MMATWEIFYKSCEGGRTRFAELREQAGKATVRTGEVFSHGVENPAPDLAATRAELVQSGYQLHRNWEFTPRAIDYDQLASELIGEIRRNPMTGRSNAIAIVTDSDFMTLGLAFHQFDDIDNTDDELLWSVDEWGPCDDSWQLDASYRWILAYGYHRNLNPGEFSDFHGNMRDTLVHVLSTFRGQKDILLVSVAGDAIGHKWSSPCMSDALFLRMLRWL